MQRIPLTATIFLLSTVVMARADAPAASPEIRTIDLKSLKSELAKLKGSPVVLNFWATWCRPCIMEMPMLGKLHAEYGPRGVVFVGVSLDSLNFDEAESKKRIPPALAKANVTYAQVLIKATGEEINEGFGLHGAIPSTLFFDADGKEVDRVEGMLDEADTKAKIAKLAAPKAKP
ncbi:MAG: TlpA disulfide reductase family protein [Acidobacteriota bacterium]